MLQLGHPRLCTYSRARVITVPKVPPAERQVLEERGRHPGTRRQIEWATVPLPEAVAGTA